MLSYLFFPTILAAVRIASAVPYEDDPRYVRKHSVLPILRASMLFVKLQSRNLVLEPRTACQALRKIQRIEPRSYRYRVYYTAPGNPAHTLGFSTTLTTSATPPHTADNVVTYQTVQRGAFYPFKVLYSSINTGCTILVFPHVQLGRACRLFQTARTVLGDIPQECLFVYMMNCPRDDMQIFDPSCFNREYRLAL